MTDTKLILSQSHLLYHEEEGDPKRPDVGGGGVVTTVTVDLRCTVRVCSDSVGTGSQNLPGILRDGQNLE